MVINTNVEAQRTADNLLESQRSLQKSLARLSSGSKIVDVSDDTAAVATSTRMESRLRRIDAVMTSLSNVVSLTQTQEGYLKTVTKALTRMSELTMLAQDSTKGSADLELYQKEFNQLNELVYNTQDKKFTGIFMFKSLTNNAQHTSVTVDEYGGQFKIPPVDFSTAKFTQAIAAPGSERSISTTAEAQITSEKLKALLEHIYQERTGVGAVQSRVEYTLNQLSTSKENLSKAKSRITDVNVANETTRFARHQILVQSGTHMLREANNLPQAALELLR